MDQVLVRFEDATLSAIDRITEAWQSERADVIRRAVKDAIFQYEMDRMWEAYRLQPDSMDDLHSWELHVGSE